MSGVDNGNKLTNGKEILTCVPFSSLIGFGFWQKFSDIVLNEVGLSGDRIPIHGYYTRSVAPALFTVEQSSFNVLPQKDRETVITEGVVLKTNTVEEFRDVDKNQLIQREGQKLIELLSTEEGLKTIAENPGRLVPFFILAYGNLKNYNYMYWFAFPAISAVKMYADGTDSSLGEVDIPEDKLQEEVKKQEEIVLSGFFIVRKTKEGVGIKPLAEDEGRGNEGNDLYGFLDTSSLDSHPCWVLRNYAAYIIQKNKYESGARIKVIGVRLLKGEIKIKSYRFSAEFPADFLKEPKFVGWEKNTKGKLLPQSVDLKSSMDPACLSQSSVDLNLKLMKWRLFPTFDLERIHQTKCLLLGAGTLGCNVARCLMAWGFKHIKFVDNSTVSYSNPVRQSLFSFQDCVQGRPKAETAAEALKTIYPGVQSSGEKIMVPMPGHPVSPATVNQVTEDFNVLEKCVLESDVIFLLLDTREARWLPSVMGAAEDKIVINAALGFDSYLVMRHGNAENNLGCYFCTDVVAPGDSTQDRTLDQQCTVTRPGVSYIASALAVELLVSLLHNNADSPLGQPPHSLRGFLSSGEFLQPSFGSFDKCTACSSLVIKEYRERKLSFIFDAMNDSKFLEELTGLDKMKDEDLLDGIVELDDDEISD